MSNAPLHDINTAAGAHEFLPGGETPGTYFLRLTQGGSEVLARAMVLR